jgi:hypothetical protein
MIFVRLISTCRFAGLSSIIVALRVEFNFAIHILIFNIQLKNKRLLLVSVYVIISNVVHFFLF